MVKFNIMMLLAGLQQALELSVKSEGWTLDFDLTLKPENVDTFSYIPDSERSSYVRHISLAYKIRIDNPNYPVPFICYLFVRNGKASNGAFIRLSSIEIVTVENGEFEPFFKEHFTDMISSRTLEFSSFEEMKHAAREVRLTLAQVIWSKAETFSLPY